MFTKYSSIDKRTIWISALGLASATGYLRMAADKHYFSDVLTGAVVGSLVGSTMFDILTKKYQKKTIFDKNTPKVSYSPNNISIFISL